MKYGTSKKELGERIRCIRKNVLNINQSELATKIGISKSFMSDVENGRTYPSFETLSKISQVAETPISNFFTTDEFKNEEISYDGENEIEKNNLINDIIKKLIISGIIQDEDNINDNVLELIMNTVKIQIKLEKEKLKK